MTDIVDRQTRSKMMSAVRAKNTKIETEIRLRLFAKGFRYRLHVRDLPGTPDIVLPKYKTVIFVHGCFWHYHGCSRSTIPDSRRNWWRKKLEDNRTRDAKALAELRRNDWRVVKKLKRPEFLKNLTKYHFMMYRTALPKSVLSAPSISRKRGHHSVSSQKSTSYAHLLMSLLWSGGNVIKLEYKPKVSGVFVSNFKGNDDAVYADKNNTDDNDRFIFKDEDGNDYEWIAELKTEHAQRDAEQFGRELSRVGLTESEWLRIKAK